MTAFDFYCSKCQHSERIIIERKIFQIRATCKCGEIVHFKIERRQGGPLRKHLDGNGKLVFNNTTKTIELVNLSINGICFKARKANNTKHIFKKGDIIEVTFLLSDRRRTEISESYVVKRINGQSIGAQILHDIDFSIAKKQKGFWLRS